ncbi:hypothetical protein M6B38_239305 [Iris pallida]|uniref:Uncharacterized protein n=1 Tax=Iris pallida TaxID=29817 RepID=A0AAX6DKZ5_IRIPA|nr:hypothetical protein M6B38_239305 [Iris pallida]
MEGKLWGKVIPSIQVTFLSKFKFLGISKHLKGKSMGNKIFQRKGNDKELNSFPFHSVNPMRPYFIIFIFRKIKEQPS